MIRTIAPAPFLETRQMLTGGAPAKPLLGAAATLQAGGRTVGFLRGGRLLAVIGVWPLGDGAFEVFVVGRPAAEVGPHLVGLVRQARLTLAAWRHSGAVRFVAFVACGHEPGRRLARLAGFCPETGGAAAGFERWERLA